MSTQRIMHEHPLSKVDPNVVYHEHQGRWSCDNCDTSADNTTMPYHCSLCNFDLCDNCFQAHRHPRHPHPLYYMNMDRVYPEFHGGWKCDGCGKNRAQLQQSHGYHCPLDQFDLCHDCFNGKMFPIHIHSLRPADSVLLYGNTIGLWKCDSCGRDGNEIGSRYSWHCSLCEFDACKGCLKQYNLDFHQHPLVITDSRISYSDYNGCWKCDQCDAVGGRGIPNKDKSFHCMLCRYDVCFSCVGRRTGWPNMGDVPCPEPQPGPVPPPIPGLMPEDEEEEPDESLRCVVCMMRRKNATIVHGSTGHICCCMHCALTLKLKGDKCPICRAPIDNVIRHFTS